MNLVEIEKPASRLQAGKDGEATAHGGKILPECSWMPKVGWVHPGFSTSVWKLLKRREMDKWLVQKCA